ncbi:YceD family protein [Dongshaea marina]|uniref:YceD family protein n=1 Tax=Dongshaea marina TaxID=2047966 RepID=UPI000D3E4053|nr:YceD family protein [Dongshaea marina]
MQKLKLPNKINPSRCASREAVYEAVIEKEQLERLDASSQGIQSDVSVKLTFEVGQSRRPLIRVDANTQVMLQCQRCGGSFSHPIEIADGCYQVVRDLSQELPEGYEPVETDEDGELDIFQLIEDELILLLPLSPMHDDADCPMADASMSWGEIAEEEERPNPFSVLERLKRNN